MDINFPDLSKKLDEIEQRLDRKIEIRMTRRAVAVAISRLKDLEPDNTAYAKAQADLGL